LNTSLFIKKILIAETEIGIPEIISMFTQLQIRVLKDITKNDSFTQYNNSNILFSGLKISGSAAYIIKDWLLYHATLLIKTNLVNMKNTLLAGSHSSKHRADSDFFPTTNLETLDVELWKKEYVSVISKEFGLRLSKRPLSQMERELNNKLTENMYSTDDWIVNKSRNDSFLYEL
jgi:lipoate-protein ligase A